MQQKSRLLGCLAGIAVGDALGMPAEFMTPQRIRNTYGYIRNLQEPDGGHIHRDLTAGQVTDDTEQNLAIIDSIMKHKKITVEVAAEALVNWAKDKDVFNSTYLGPSSRKALIMLMEGQDPNTTGNFGTTIGAAMRAPAAAVFWPEDIDKSIESSAFISIPTHSTSLAISGATSISAALAECFRKDANPRSVVAAAKYGAGKGLDYGYPYPGASIAKRIDLALKLTKGVTDPDQAAAILYDYIGVDMFPHEIIPLIIALFTLERAEPFEILLAVVNIGGDSDTSASLLGALLGAYYGIEIFPEDLWRKVDELNRLNLEEYAAGIIRTELISSEKEKTVKNNPVKKKEIDIQGTGDKKTDKRDKRVSGN